MNPQIKGIFWKKDEIVYRNRTKIIFNGNEDTCIGIILMLNPGSCKPQDGYNITNEENEFPCNKDITILKIIECIIQSQYNNVSGYVYIVNLCDKKGTEEKNLKPKDLLEKDFRKYDEVVREIRKKIEEPQNQVKWIWVAFGKESKGKNKETRLRLEETKEEVLNQLNKLFLNKIVGESVKYMHPYNLNYLI